MAHKHPHWYDLVRTVVKWVYFGTHGGFEVFGIENVPATGPVIVAPNHVSVLDPPAMGSASNRRLNFMAKEELFAHWFFGPMTRSVGGFPVRRGEGDSEAIRKTLALLEEGAAMLIFPEGTRGNGETLGAMVRGVAMFAKKSGAPILPVGIIGTHVLWPKNRRGHRHRVTVAFGKPFTYEDVARSEAARGLSDKEIRELFLRRLENDIQALCAQHGMPVKTAMQTKGPEALSDPAQST